MTSQERSIFQSNGMPLCFSENAAIVCPRSPMWMSRFSIRQTAHPLSQGAGAFPGPTFEIPVDPEEYTPEVRAAKEKATISGESSGLPEGQATREEFVLPSSFSWTVKPHQAGFQLFSPAMQRGEVRRAGQDLAWASPEEYEEKSLGSGAGSFSELKPQLFPTFAVEPALAGGEASLASAPAMSEIQPREESGKNVATGKFPERRSGDSRAARVEDWSYQQSLGMTTLGSPRPAPAPNRDSTLTALRVSVSPRTVNPGMASPRQTSASRHSWVANTLSEQRMLPEVLTTTEAPRAAALDVLEQLSSPAPRAAASPAQGRRVHIGKLHITVQRPVGEARPQPAPVLDAWRVSEAADQVFVDPWERHYSSFD